MTNVRFEIRSKFIQKNKRNTLSSWTWSSLKNQKIFDFGKISRNIWIILVDLDNLLHFFSVRETDLDLH